MTVRLDPRSLIQAIVVAAALVAPVASFAQSNAPVTRAQVRAQIVQLEKAGYDPSGVPTDYPVGLMAAEAQGDCTRRRNRRNRRRRRRGRLVRVGTPGHLQGRRCQVDGQAAVK
jgi:hypothetical protein